MNHEVILLFFTVLRLVIQHTRVKGLELIKEGESESSGPCWWRVSISFPTAIPCFSPPLNYKLSGHVGTSQNVLVVSHFSNSVLPKT